MNLDFIKDIFGFKKQGLWENPLKIFLPKRMLGIDVGTSSIKIVEISRWGQGKTLENYGEIKSTALFKESYKSIEKGTYLISNYFIARAIRAILEEAKMKTRAAIFAIPDFATFCTSFELPPMTAKELPEAVYYNASQFIPLPITETTLDWKLIEGTPGDNKSPLKIFLVAIPSQTVQNYQKIAEMAGLELYAVEAEVLSLERALVKDKKQTVCLIDIGAQSTTVSIVDNKRVKRSYSIDFSGGQLNKALSSVLNISSKEAEEIKIQKGLYAPQKETLKTFFLLLDPLIFQVKNILYSFSQEEKKEVELIFLTGGNSALPGIKEYFAEVLKKRVEIPNCFNDLLYPPILEKILLELSPRFSVAVGAALGGLEI